MGGNGGNDTQEVVTNGSRVESFLLRNGTYDWDRDQAGVKFLELAQQYAVPYINFFINAAPSAIASNGAACSQNRTADKVDAFADYIETVLAHWVADGIDIKYISPMNEPDNNRSDCSQERMAVVPTLRARVFEAIRAALDNSTADSVDIIGDETSRVILQAVPEDRVRAACRFETPSEKTVSSRVRPADNRRREIAALQQHLVPAYGALKCCEPEAHAKS